MGAAIARAPMVSAVAPVTPRPLRPEEERAVRALREACTPNAAPLPALWHFAHPTLVLEADDMLIGSTSFTLSPHAKKGYVVYGADLCVHPDYRRRGYARLLHAARCDLARALGAVDFVGTVKADNEAMKALLTSAGCRRMSSALGHEFWIGRL